MNGAPTRIAVVGCGYVFDFYMATLPRHDDLELAGVFDTDAERMVAVQLRYGLRTYPSLAALLADESVTLVCNFTSIPAHYQVTRIALEAGKHVYSEKPLVTDMGEARELFALANAKGLILACAPSNLFSDTVQTMWRAVRAGKVGTPLLAYAEFDDGPIFAQHPERWHSASGAPWPYVHEYESGCTFEHAGYHLVWLCAILGPVRSVTGFSKQLVLDKTGEPLTPPDTPDFSVGCLHFENGAVARLTCSLLPPADHRMRIFGRDAELSADTYRDYQAPVRLERWNGKALSARRLRFLRDNPQLARSLGVGGTKLPLVRTHRSRARPSPFKLNPRAAVRNWKKREEGEQDKALGVALTCEAIRDGRPSPIPADFILHVTELTLVLQRAGLDGCAHTMESSFEPLTPLDMR